MTWTGRLAAMLFSGALVIGLAGCDSAEEPPPGGGQPQSMQDSFMPQGDVAGAIHGEGKGAV